MSSTSRQWLVVAASGVLSALMVGLPSQAEPRRAEPVLEYASATCGAAGDREVEFILTDAHGDPAQRSTLADIEIRVGAGSSPWQEADFAGTLRTGTALPAPGEGSLVGSAYVPGDAGHVAVKAVVERADGEQFVLNGSTDLSVCEPLEPEQLAELEQPGRVWGPYGGKRTIPTHASPSGGQTTHPSVVKVPGGWNGYTYWMAHTPYPGSNSAWEDPNIAASNDGVNWVVPAGLSNPIEDQPGLPGPYNSDTDLQMGPGNTMYVFWRTVIPDLAQERIKYSTSTDGVNWSAPAEAVRSSMSVRRPLSPAFLYENGRWVMWAVDIVRSPNRIIYYVGGATPAKANWTTTPVYANLGAMQSGKEPWHLSIVKDGSAYIGLLNDTVLGSTGRDGDLLFITGSTPLSFTNAQMSVVPRTKPGQHDHLYRATMYADTEFGKPGYRVWYSARIALNPDVWNVQQTFLHGAEVHGSP
ncbi:hypothetical protein [Glycomyces algeriensis]|uniref:Uncharacterized protein n=1 Tax=Glycomyces algeriensis TaxID=256037 RepID=A0A9W6LIZ8_9ACTN|nr:hypothetical protein [Glycomyces algeriensis]MDA1368567.1 hypothetical protein [Glycomyces algeriensis]MDR7352366.1 hypothetical protein [Glycomyces algeriensis]GLI45103.1 hypothetical protein GALLR39Z86_49530 [Glycomyces algeriensis]